MPALAGQQQLLGRGEGGVAKGIDAVGVGLVVGVEHGAMDVAPEFVGCLCGGEGHAGASEGTKMGAVVEIKEEEVENSAAEAVEGLGDVTGELELHVLRVEAVTVKIVAEDGAGRSGASSSSLALALVLALALASVVARVEGMLVL